VYTQNYSISKVFFCNSYGDLREEIVVADFGVVSASGEAPSGIVFMKKKPASGGMNLYIANTSTGKITLTKIRIKMENVGYGGYGNGYKVDSSGAIPVDSAMVQI
jgi:hypothetical protein